MRSSLLKYSSSSYPEYPPQEPSMHCIIPSNNNKGGLWLGNLASAKNKNELQQKNIGAVLSVMSDKEVNYDRNIQHLFIRADDADFQQLDKFFDEAIRFIENQRRFTNVLVHCYAGISRSTTLVLAFLMKTFGFGLTNALYKIQSIRSIVNPNPGFLRQLQQFEQIISGRDAKRPISSYEDRAYMTRYGASDMSYRQPNRLSFETQNYDYPPSSLTSSYVKQRSPVDLLTNSYGRSSTFQVEQNYNKYVDLRKSMTSMNNTRPYVYNPASPSENFMSKQRSLYNSSAYNRNQYYY